MLKESRGAFKAYMCACMLCIRMYTHVLLPLHAFVDGRNGRERVEAELQVKVAAAEVVHDAHLVTARRKVQRGRPATIAVTAYEGPAVWK